LPKIDSTSTRKYGLSFLDVDAPILDPAEDWKLRHHLDENVMVPTAPTAKALHLANNIQLGVGFKIWPTRPGRP
jgi:hypothetical protein